MELTASDNYQVSEILERLVDAWNRDDMDGFVALFTADATYVSGAGVLLKGSQAIRDGLSKQRGSGESDTVEITDASVSLVTSDVALVHSNWKMPGRTDERLQSRKGIFTLVVIRDHDRWRIAALQNTDRVH